MKINISILLLFLLSQIVAAQDFQVLNAPVVIDGDQLNSPWTGGMNAPQWSKADLNNDGKMDLYAFDRDGNVHIPFVNIGEDIESEYQFAPEMVANFPLTWNFVLMRDFNGDGITDYFGNSQHIGVPGFQVYRGFFENGELKLDLMEFDQWAFDVITIPLGTGGFANLNVNRIDYPAIDDIDNDGDMDIVVLDTDAGREFIYYKNHALEEGFTLDTLIFKREDACWLRTFLPDETTHFDLSCDPNICAADCFDNPNNELDKTGGLHGASAICTFDEDNDGDKEVLYGDLNFPQIMKALNGGTPDAGWATEQDTTFPSYNSPVHMHDYPAAYHLDFDNDGRRDLLVSPNESNVSADVETWFYKNTNTEEFPQFSFVKKDAMVEDMIDVGKGSHPAFFDYNADGLMDFVVGNFEKTTTTPDQNVKEASIYLFENIGTAEEPSFELVDSDWLGFKQFSSQTTQFAPAFGDIDQDGDIDLFVGEEEGYMFFVENTSGVGNPATWGLIQPRWNNIRIGNYPKPLIYDLNKDGLEDLIVGEKGGNINYLPNLGTTGNPVFHDNPNEAPNNKFIGSISTIDVSGDGYSSPFIIEEGEDVIFLTGNAAGQIDAYLVDTTKLEFGDTFELIETGLAGLDVGRFSTISLTNLNNDNHYDLLIGGRRGGLWLYSTPYLIDTEVPVKQVINELGFSVFPNPTNSTINLKLDKNYFDKINFEIINTLGQIVKNGQLNNGDKIIDLAFLGEGVYFIKIKIGEQIGIKKVVLKK